ncbi:hypothetical protein ACOSP7_017258 [Xanthoceras sorbifolium]
MLPKKLIDRMIKSPHTLRKQLFPEEISGHNLHDSGETEADVVHPIPPPLVLDMDNLKKAPVMDDGATSDSVDSLLVGSLSLPLPQDTVSRIKSDKKKKWKRLARFEMQGQEAMIPNSSLGERLSVEEAIVVNSVSKKGRVSHSLDGDVGSADVRVVSHFGKVWRLTGFYGHPTASQHLHAWTLLRRLHEWRGKIVLFIGVASILKSVGRTKKNVKKLFQIVGLIFMARLLCIKWFSKLTVLLKY